jgi:phosphonopyruvate decarboxylase
MSIGAETFIDACVGRGYDFFTGVPCSFLTPLIDGVIGSPKLTYVGATSEGEAVGVAAGAWIAGRKTVVMCQNSGFGNIVNPLTSLNRPFRVPTLVVSTWRGQPGLEDEPQHEQMGRIITGLIECLELRWRLFPEATGDVDAVVREVTAAMEAGRLPFVLLMRQGTVAAGRTSPCPVPRTPAGTWRDARRNAGRDVFRTDALRVVLEACPRESFFVATTGMTGRELFALRDQPNNFYTVGSMGCASAIGLGLALGCRTDMDGVLVPPTVVLDGDGAALMKLGNLATIGRHRPERFVHVVLNNGVHDSTGGQATSGGVVDFAALAVACGYASGVRVDDAPGLGDALALACASPGPHLVEMTIRPGSPRGIGRPTLTPVEVIDRFRATVRGQR